MKRRKFIGSLSLGAAGFIAGGYIFFEKFESLARKIIIADTSSLNVSSTEIDKFFADVAKSRNAINSFPSSNQQLIKWHYHMDNSLFNLPYYSKYMQYRSKIVGFFLLSTDFFINKMDPAKPVKYRALYDPYQIPCSNPFSSTFYPDV